MKLPDAYITRMKHSLGDGFPAYLSAMNEPPARSLRVNTLKISPEDLLTLLPVACSPNDISEDCFRVPDELSPGKDPLHIAGLYYMQEASAQMPVHLLDIRPGERVLDLCAAPGGKSGQIAAALQHKGLLISNEIVPSRATVLRRTLERLGVRNAIITNAHPTSVCDVLSGFCDAVLVDAPCSGEGMFRKEPDAVWDWSLEHVTSCAIRQREILKSAAGAVRPGGRLVYSTCTFSAEENEDNARWFCRTFPDFSLVQEIRCYPHTCAGEGQYAALFVKNGSNTRQHTAITSRSDKIDAYRAFAKDTFIEVPHGSLRLLPDGRVFILPDELPEGIDKLRILCSGVEAGEVKNGRFIPVHALFLAYSKEMFRLYEEPSEPVLRAFLAGEQISSCRSESGYIAVGCNGFPLGFGKLSDGQIKNHFPKGLRIR